MSQPPDSAGGSRYNPFAAFQQNAETAPRSDDLQPGETVILDGESYTVQRNPTSPGVILVLSNEVSESEGHVHPNRSQSEATVSTQKVNDLSQK